MTIDKDIYYTFGIIKSDLQWRVVMLNARSSNYTSNRNILAELFVVHVGWMKTEAILNPKKKN